jgi:hypothetical protein
MSGHFTIEWQDFGREPRVAPNPAFPDGIDLDISAGRIPSCRVELPYPAARCGAYRVECSLCGMAVVATTAGRPDDPRSLTMACNPKGQPR